MTLPADARRVLIQETVVNTVISGALAALITWLIFRGRQDIPLLGGPESGVFGIVPGTFMFSALVTLALSLIMRAVVAGLIMWLLIVPATLLLLSASAPPVVSFAGLLAFFVVYFVVLTLIVVPLVILRSLLPCAAYRGAGIRFQQRQTG